VAILLLGGYGNTGRLIAELLLQHTAETVIVAGRSGEKAEEAACRLRRRFPAERVRSVRADAADATTLRSALQGASMVVVASSTSEHTGTLARAAMDGEVDYIDLAVSRSKIETLQRMRSEILSAGRCFITDAGFHPGIPAVLVRYAATRFDRLESATVKSVIKLDWSHYQFSDSTRREIAEELRQYKTLHFHDGAWVEAGFSHYIETDFGEPFGKQHELPMFLEELRALPEQTPSLKETGFYVGGFNWFSDNIALPLGFGAVSLLRDRALPAVGKALEWSLKTFSKPPYGTVLLLEASGTVAGEAHQLRLKLSHADGYYLTAASVAACVTQLLEGGIRKPGLYCEGNLVEPQRLLQQIDQMGVTIEDPATEWCTAQ
jgi:hypothetical protein